DGFVFGDRQDARGSRLGGIPPSAGEHGVGQSLARQGSGRSSIGRAGPAAPHSGKPGGAGATLRPLRAGSRVGRVRGGSPGAGTVEIFEEMGATMPRKIACLDRLLNLLRT